MLSGASIPPEAMMHFLLVSESPLFPTNFSDSAKNFPDFTFSEKISRFSSTKISDDFFSHRLQISKFPPQFRSYPLISGQFLIPLLFQNFPLISSNLHGFYILSVHFVSPLLLP